MSEATIDEGFSQYGTRSQMHLHSDAIVVQKTYDAEPILLACEQARQATEGMRWGEGKVVGKVPMVVFTQCLHMEPKDQHLFLSNWLRQNSQFVTFDKFLK